MVGINYSDKIPNNVNLDEDPRLQRALESWQPEFLNWWKELGPFKALEHDVYLRTAVSVEPSGSELSEPSNETMLPTRTV